jgi:hypothetical protein
MIMESIRLYDQPDFNAFFRRRGIVVIIGLIMFLGIVLIHLYKLYVL